MKSATLVVGIVIGLLTAALIGMSFSQDGGKEAVSELKTKIQELDKRVTDLETVILVDDEDDKDKKDEKK